MRPASVVTSVSDELADLFDPSDRPVAASWTTDLSSAREALWPLLADTSRLNQRLGLPEMSFEERDGKLFLPTGRNPSGSPPAVVVWLDDPRPAQALWISRCQFRQRSQGTLESRVQ